MSIRPRTISLLEHQVIIDRLTICFTDNNATYVQNTCALLLSETYQRNIPGLQIRRNGRYRVSALIPVPFSTHSPDRHPIFFEAGPRLPRLSSYRLDFNPSKLSREGLNDLRVLLANFTDAEPEEFISLGRVTRVDAAIDLLDQTLDELIVLAARMQKHGVYSDRHGTPETVYLGTPRSSCVVAYTKLDDDRAEIGTRLECRVKPQCIGRHVAALPNPFAKVRIIRAQALDDVVRGVPGQLIADSIRLRGINRTLQVFSQDRQRRIRAALNSRSLMPDADTRWAG